MTVMMVVVMVVNHYENIDDDDGGVCTIQTAKKMEVLRSFTA